MHCEEKYRLIDVYRAALAGHSAAVNDLALTQGWASKEEYERLWALAQNAQRETEAASDELLRDAREHGC
jgi:hypothetical protein